jgi:hypothetical protein
MSYVTWADTTSTWATDITKWSSQLYTATATLNSTNSITQTSSLQAVGNISLLQAILMKKIESLQYMVY